MKICAIRDEELGPERVLGYLFYYERARAFYIELPEDADPWETPMLLDSFVKRGQLTVNARWSRLWVQQRVIPPDRQNIGQILRENGLHEYDKFALLLLAEGRCAQDRCYIEQLKPEDLPAWVVRRRETRVAEVVPASGNSLLVFFRNGEARRCDAATLVGQERVFRRVLKDRSLFETVSVETDGFGICWSEETSIGCDELYRSGIPLPLSAEDLQSFARTRLINTADAARLLNCSRQNVDDLVRRSRLTPVRTDERNKLFLKTEVLQWAERE